MSRVAQSTSRSLKTSTFEDIVALVALIRPGPLGAGMHNEFTDRATGRKDIEYLHKDLDTSNSILVGAMVGAGFGPIGLVPLWMKTPDISRKLILIPAFVSVGIIMIAFALADPGNNCVSNGSFVASQITNGLIIGIIYGLMALGLTLIFSILGIVSFSHGEFYMIGGMIVYLLYKKIMPVLHGVK